MAHDRSRVRTRPPRGDRGTPHCTTDADDIEPFLHDEASFPGAHTPKVCFPRNEAEIAGLLHSERHVLCVGAQSSLTGGATPCGETVLSSARLARTFELRADRVVVGPGLLLRTMIDKLAAQGRYYPPVPTYDGATIGGTVATNAAGAATFKHGTTRDWVERLVVVLACGEVLELHRGEVTADERGGFDIVLLDDSQIRVERPNIEMPDVPKISSGYYSRPGMDLIDLFIGSEGTLGVVAEIELRLIDKPAPFVAILPLPSEAAMIALVGDLRDETLRARNTGDPGGLDVAAIEYMDAASLALLEQDRAATRYSVAVNTTEKAMLLLQLELPGGTTDTDVILDLQNSRDPNRDSPLLRLYRVLDRHRLVGETVPTLPGEPARQNSLFALREAVPAGVNERIRRAQRSLGPEITKAAADVIVPFRRLGEAMRTYREIAARQRIQCLIWGHVSDGNVHPNLIPRTVDEANRAPIALLEMGRAAIALGGAPMAEHGIGRNQIKQHLLRDLYGSAGVASMRAVKRALDPRNVLAPGIIFSR